MGKVVLGFSGGVDSAVAARLLLEAGYDVLGLYLDIGLHNGLADAQKAAKELGIPLTVRDVRADLETCVCAPFLHGYLQGRTLNPCLICNPRVKFRRIAQYAAETGAQKIATGHYAVVRDGALFMGHADNDQSYQLCLLPKAYLTKLLLPLGGMEKPRAREIARAAGVSIYDKPDSMDICFIPDHDYAAWIETRAQAPGPGNVVFEKKVVGEHAGIHRYTVGQRWGETESGRRLYVSAIHPETNEIEVALWDALFKTRVEATQMNWLTEAPVSPFRARVRARHTRWETPDCLVTPTDTGVLIQTDTPLRAPAPGQAAALYDGERLLGGGLIV